jgi:hypothetical protein
MRERAELFGGTVAAEPQPDGGFRVRLCLPYPDAGQWQADDRPSLPTPESEIVS